MSQSIVSSGTEERSIAMFRALSNPLRFRIVTLLAERKDMTAGQIQHELPIAQSSLFEHLAQLRNSEIVQTSGGENKTHRSYCLNPDALAFLRSYLGGLGDADKQWSAGQYREGAPVIRDATPTDAHAIAAIYNQGIEDRVATLETQARSAEERAAWMAAKGPRHPVMVATNDEGQVVGWASLNPFSPRPAYDHVVDFSVYVDREQRGKGIGDALLGAVEERARSLGYHKIVLAAFPTNAPGMRLYQRHGFATVGIYREQGMLDGKWVDTIVMEKLLA